MADDAPILDYESPAESFRPISVLAEAAGVLAILGCPCLQLPAVYWLTRLLGDRVAQVVGVVLAVGVPLTGFALGIATILHVRSSQGRMRGARAGWAAVIFSTLWIGFYIAMWMAFPAQS